MTVEPVAAFVRATMKEWMIAVIDAPEMIFHDRELSRKTFNSQLAHNDSFGMEIQQAKSALELAVRITRQICGGDTELLSSAASTQTTFVTVGDVELRPCAICCAKTQCGGRLFPAQCVAAGKGMRKAVGAASSLGAKAACR